MTFLVVRHFNSIKVRLKRAAPQYVAKYVKFQFHKGTIKTFAFLPNTLLSLQNFNSIKVRLKPYYAISSIHL